MFIDAAGKKQMLIECQGTEKEGLLFCEVKKLR